MTISKKKKNRKRKQEAIQKWIKHKHLHSAMKREIKVMGNKRTGK